MLADFLTGLQNALHPLNLLIMSLALAGGIAIGTLPGLTATMGVALLVPLTFGMDPASGLLMLGAMYCGAIYGGANSAILINTPGTPSAVCTTFDGYPLTKQGRADEALFTALVSSVIGGIIGTIFLMFAAQPLALVSLKFGSPEYFWLAIFGLTIISSLSEGNMVKGLLGGALGLLLATIGIDPVTGHTRFTFGFRPLIEGVTLIPAMIGFFSFAQVLSLVDEDQKYIAEYSPIPGVIGKVFSKLLKDCKNIILRSSLIGTFVGILPGAGGNVASFVAYNEAKRWSKNPDIYGTGAIEGVAASESSNNATVSSSLIPLLSLGIPGSPVAAVLLGGLLIHGMRPGAKLFIETGEVAYTFIIGLVVANLLMLFVGYLGMRIFAQVLNVPSHYITTIVIVLSFIGSYAIRNSLVDVVIMMVCGVLGYLGLKVGIQPGPIVLGLILGTIAEEGFTLSLLMSKAQGSLLSTFVTRPISAFLIFMCILSIVSPIYVRMKKSRKDKLEQNV
ncbi:MAG: putative tricarboxylic transport rane protein [Clostridia bacterium]|jgi:putative tricarboxylic transport membrane protein|nr:putative tricarboxylic transport rane protein [Clostridia bacterium]MDN5324266.1 putative tricarboxylic transport rane protein [Clostridia bacterium]